VNIIEAFINDGGKFVAWICGHIHKDFFGYVTGHPQITVFANDKVGVGRNHDTYRKNASDSQDVMNLITIDTRNKLLKIIRVGSYLDEMMRVKDMQCFNYQTKEMV
jgi:hypothetical protein